MAGVAPLVVSKTLPPPDVNVTTSSFHILKEPSLLDISRRFMELFGVREEELRRICELIVERAVKPLLSVELEEMVETFNEGYPIFELYMKSLLSSFSIPRLYALHLEETFKLLDEIVELERKFYELYLRLLKERCTEANIPIEDLEYAIAQLFDYDLWLIGKIKELGIEEFLMLLMKRADEEARSMYSYLLALLYVTTAINVALFGMVTYNKENLRVLVEWAKHYAKELDAYIDTVNLLITDEYYDAIEEYLKEKRRGCKNVKS